MSAPTPPLTRRQRREAERAAEAAAARAALAHTVGSEAQVEVPGSDDDGAHRAGLSVGNAEVPAPTDRTRAATGSVPPVPVAAAEVAVEACEAARAMDPVACGGHHRTTWDEIVAPQASTGSVEDTATVDTAAVSRRSRRAENASRRPRNTVARSARSRRAPQRHPSGVATRAGVMGVLGVVTILAPLASSASGPVAASAALGLSAEPTARAGATATATDSVAAEVLASGSDADVDQSASDATLRNVPDAATRARIREAYENAAVTCSPTTTAASGDSAAFAAAPTLFYPMVAGTYSVSSAYGWRLHPTLGYLKLHAGQDYAAPEGTPIYAVADGTVTTAGMVGGVGTVTIRHEIDGQTWYSSYLHMYSDGIYVSAGDHVTAGQLIAGVGNTGQSTGAHLHFEVRTADDTSDKTTVDPATWLSAHRAAQLSTDCS